MGPLLSAVLLCLLTLLLPIWYLRYHSKRKRLYELASQFDGPPTIPFLGNYTKFLIPIEDVAKAMINEMKYYKSPTRVWFGPQLLIHIWDPKQLQIILNSSNCLGKPTSYKLTELVTGNGLLNLPVDTWKRHRRIIAPIFNEENVRNSFAVIRKHCAGLTEKLSCYQSKGFFDIKSELYKCTLTIAIDAILGCDDKNTSEDSRFEQFTESLEGVQIDAMNRLINKWYLPDFVFNMTPTGRNLKKQSLIYNAYVDKVVKQWEEKTRKKNLENYVNDKSTNESEETQRIVEYLLSLSGNNKLDAEELRSEVKNMISGAFGTTALSMGYILVVLGMFPDVQDRVLQEITKVLGEQGQIQYEDLQKLEYTQRVIKETLRIFPIAPGMARYVEQEIQLEERTIPAGSLALIGMFSLHRDPDVWPDPSKFDPDRFLPEEVAKRHPYSWLPFSGGVRNCIGNRFGLMVLAASTIELVRKYKISTIYKDIDDVDLKFYFFFHPTRGFQIKLESREQAKH